MSPAFSTPKRIDKDSSKALQGCKSSMESLTIPNSVKEIEKGAFAASSFKF